MYFRINIYFIHITTINNSCTCSINSVCIIRANVLYADTAYVISFAYKQHNELPVVFLQLVKFAVLFLCLQALEYGPDCIYQCDQCVHSNSCDSITGQCHCLPGYSGDFCTQPCPKGFYGNQCQQVCRWDSGVLYSLTAIFALMNISRLHFKLLLL